MSSGVLPVDSMAWRIEADIAEAEESRTGFADWSMRIPEARGPLNFDAWPFQRELYEQGFDEREAVIMKATQLGCSAWLIRWGLFWADRRGAVVLYVFPRERQLLDFSDGRVRPLILGEYLRTRVPAASVQNKSLKSVGPGVVYFRGSESEQGLESIDADCLAFDEHDLLVQEHIPVAERRIGASDLGLIRRIGFPTISDHGIHREFGRSDQRQWFVQCGSCNLRQPVTWEENVDLKRGIRVCSKCRKPLDVSAGEWVAKHPDRDVRGYHVSKLIVPRNDIMPRLIAASEDRTPFKRQIFFNRDLGLPWESSDARLTPSLIAACQRRELVQQANYVGESLVVAGIDVASTRDLNIWISERPGDGHHGRVLFVGPVDSFEGAARLMDRFRVGMAVVDHLPEGRLARAFVERFAGRAYIINYGTDAQRDVLTVDAEQRRASVKRTEALDAAFERIRSMRELLPMDLPKGFVSQMCANVRCVERDDVGRVRVVYRASEPDDYAQASVYATVAAELWWVQRQVEHREEVTSLDEMTDSAFERSTLGDEDADDEYSPGPDGMAYADPGNEFG